MMDTKAVLKFGLLLTLWMSLVSCGGLQSVKKLKKIKPPEDLQAVDIQIEAGPKSAGTSAQEKSQSKSDVEKTLKVVPSKSVEKKKLGVYETQDALNRKKWYGDTKAFRVGEKTTFALSWFAVKAGEITMEVHPYVYVNGRKAYHFVGRAKSSGMMDLIHSVDDWIESYVDTDTFYPYKSALHGVETDRLREGLTLFNYNTKKVFYWMKSVHTKKGTKEKRRTDAFTPGMLDIFTSAFYLRVQPLKVGKTYSSLVYNGGKRITVDAKVLRKEKFDTDLGTFNTLLIRPEARFQGILKTSGDTAFWVSDDPRHLILGLESKIKIGYLRARVKKIEDIEYKLPSDEED